VTAVRRPVRDDVDPEAIPGDARAICAALGAAGHGAWVVGGCVRDHLLGRAVSDWDVCTSARPEEVVRLFPRSIPTGMAHGTVTVVRGGAHYEVTTLRGEGTYSDGRRPDAVHFLDDVRRRPRAARFHRQRHRVRPAAGTRLVDPFGGRDDLRAGLLRAVGDALQRFREDGLRVLRGARFVASLGFTLEPDTEAAITGALDVFQRVSAERVRDEWVKTLKAPRPSGAFRVMHRRGILGLVAPALDALAAQPSRHAPALDGLSHALNMIDAVAADPTLRVAALWALADDDARRLSGAVSVWLKQWRFSNGEHERVVRAVRHWQAVEGLHDGDDAALRRWMRDTTEAGVDDALALAAACCDAGGEAARRAAIDSVARRVAAQREAGVALTPRALAVDGAALMGALGLPPGKALGALMAALLEAVLDEPARNTPEALLALARTLHAQSSQGA
jgi:tRNA nucleotidyltransferase (CCA-adding enzyme)